VGAPRYIGKESNSLEEVEAGIIGDADSVYVTYRDGNRELSQLRSVLKTLPRTPVARRAGISTRRLQDVIHGNAEPRPKMRRGLIEAASAELMIRLQSSGIAVPVGAPFEMLAATWLKSTDCPNVPPRHE
jgi:hypothetical protein